MKEIQGLPDTQNEPDHREIVIDRVGVRELRYPAKYAGADGAEQATVAKFEMTVELPAHLKGTHMSRFVETLHGLTVPLTGASIARLTRELAGKLQAERAQIGCEFPIFLQKEAPVSGMKSMMDYELGMEYRFSTKEECALFLSVQIPVATLCPLLEGD